MKEYYKVKPEYDNFRLFDVNTRKYKGILIGKELYTERELVKRNILNMHGVRFDMFELVKLSPRKTYFMFGARFA